MDHQQSLFRLQHTLPRRPSKHKCSKKSSSLKYKIFTFCSLRTMHRTRVLNREGDLRFVQEYKVVREVKAQVEELSSDPCSFIKTIIKMRVSMKKFTSAITSFRRHSFKRANSYSLRPRSSTKVLSLISRSNMKLIGIEFVTFKCFCGAVL